MASFGPEGLLVAESSVASISQTNPTPQPPGSRQDSALCRGFGEITFFPKRTHRGVGSRRPTSDFCFPRAGEFHLDHAPNGAIRLDGVWRKSCTRCYLNRSPSWLQAHSGNGTDHPIGFVPPTPSTRVSRGSRLGWTERKRESCPNFRGSASTVSGPTSGWMSDPDRTRNHPDEANAGYLPGSQTNPTPERPAEQVGR